MPPLTSSKSQRKQLASDPPRVLKRRATCLEQNASMPLYQFALTNREMAAVVDISRLARDDSGVLLGYQRPEVKRHVRDIVSYLDSESPLFPHPIIVAFSSAVEFTLTPGGRDSDDTSKAGQISIPLPLVNGPKPGWIVDGQQRALALSRTKRQDFPVPICAFITDDLEIQRDQFLRINNSRPLPRGLITELLPEVSMPLPARMAVRRLPAALCDELNREDGSPFLGMIRRPSTPASQKARAVISDTVIVKMLQESLMHTSGCLFPYQNFATGESDLDGIWNVVTTFWESVRDTFPDAWGKPPAASRLMHGVGIHAMGKLMDRVMSSIDSRRKDIDRVVRQELAVLAPVCRWTSGRWEDLGDIEWNALQNVSKHYSILSNYLIRTYLELRHG